MMPFGLQNTPRAFKNIIYMVFFDLLDIYIVIYLDDLFVFSKIVGEKQKALNTVFAHLAKHQLYLRPDKCALLHKHVELPGYISDASSVYMQQKRINAIIKQPETLQYNPVAAVSWT